MLHTLLWLIQTPTHRFSYQHSISITLVIKEFSCGWDDKKGYFRTNHTDTVKHEVGQHLNKAVVSCREQLCSTDALQTNTNGPKLAEKKLIFLWIYQQKKYILGEAITYLYRRSCKQYSHDIRLAQMANCYETINIWFPHCCLYLSLRIDSALYDLNIELWILT